MQSALSIKSNNEISHNTDVVEMFTLGPQQDAKVPLGMFEADVPQPHFQIEYHPQTEALEGVVAALERMDKEDEYWLVYYLQNFTDNSYHITIREKPTEI